MRIKRLDITGFKSFMDRSVFSFDLGITGIVGPNGCGKSNVVDAIRWAMGEQSAKNLRGRGMEDVIFNGSESKPPLSMAEVSLTFSVEDVDVLPQPYAGFSEITVTRRLFRSGESEYLINKTPCRLLDITEVFLGTGVGTKAYSIIEQGRVGLIVSSKPEDRRSLIEEAAGVTKYKSRRKAAERKMDATQQNLLRVTDLVSELEKRLDSLGRQAKKAEKYRRLKAEARELELHIASHRFQELSTEQSALQAKLEALGKDEHQSLEQLRALEEAIALQRSELERETAQLQELQEQVHALETQLQRDEQNLAYWEADARTTEDQRTRASEEAASLRAQQEGLARRATELETELEEIAALGRGEEGQVQRVQEEVRAATLAQADVSIRLEQERAALVGLAARVANHESNLQNLTRRQEDLLARQQKTAAEAAGLMEEEARLERARGQMGQQVNERRQLTLELAERKGVEEEALVRTRQAFTENEVVVLGLREELADKRSRLGSLEEIQRAYEGFDRGVRSVMQHAGEHPREKGIFGLVADVLSTSPRFEKAVEAALGERLQHVLVESREKGLELVALLKDSAEGRSSFLPLPASGERAEAAAPAALLGTPGVLALAAEEVRCEETFAPVAQRLLAGVVIVEDLEQARALLAREDAAGVTLVTLDGEVLRPDGSVTGGLLEGPAVGALQKKREVAELSAEVASLTGRYQEIVTRHHELQKSLAHTEDVLKGLARNQHVEELGLAGQEKDLHRAVEDLTRVRDRLAALRAEEAQLLEAASSLRFETDASRDEVGHAHAERAGREDRVRELTLELQGLRERADAKSAELMTLRVKVAAHVERAESAKRELARLQVQREELTERTAKLDEAVTAGRDKLEELGRRMDEARESSAQARFARDELSGSLEHRRQNQQAAAARVRDEEARLKDVRTRLEELTQGLTQISLRERELVLELTHLLEGIRERHQTELAEELPLYQERGAPGAEVEVQLKDLRGQLERMGEINLTAIEEHAEVEQRFEFLNRQKLDLDASLAQLKEAIVKIDRTSRERFNQTFHVVNEKFQEVFPRMFGGGRAGLILTEEGPGGEQGVEIVAQPPGKKLQSVTLLSGGEKALTAVALLFAIFLIKPTPFCLLDEVDAPLDEGNVGRYNDMVKEMSKQSQFILITHNKRTMEIGDTLYGVTMEEPGISKLVAVKMREALAQTSDDQAAG